MIFLLYGCQNTSGNQEINVEQFGGEGGTKEIYQIKNPEDLELLKTIIDNETWKKQTLYTGTDYVGTDYTFTLNENNYDVLIDESEKSIMVYRHTIDGEVERAYIPLYEQAEAFFELITGRSFTQD
ncbi:hypothetical protein ACOJQI_11310 [Bacillus salacetis]|uniref:hypothetical protein n=1 Tax=Bacillus salacetis TaxID=2315464 RepID=UPI003BA160AC